MNEWFQGLERREQYVVLGGAAVLALYLVWYLLIGPVFAAAAESAKNVEAKSAILAEMRQSAARLGTMPRTSRPVDNSNQSLVVIVGRSATTAGLEQQLKQNQPAGENNIRVRFEAAPFNGLVTWLGRLQSEYQLSIQSASFDRSSPEGTVDARITLERTGS